MAKNDFQYAGWNILTPCNVACDSGIVTVNSPSGSTLRCDTWLWDGMPVNSPKRPPYQNSTSGFHFHTSLQSTCHSVPVCEILSKSDHPRQKENDFIFKMSDLRHLGFQGSVMDSLNSPCTTSYRSSIATSSKLLFLRKSLICILATDRQTNRQTNRRTNRWTAPMH